MKKIKNSKMLSIRIKLLISYSTVFIIIGTFGSVLLYSLIKTTIQENVEHQLENSTTTILNMVNTATKSSIKNYLYGLSQQNLGVVRHFYNKFRQGRLTEKEAKELIAGILLEQQIGQTGYCFVWDISRAPESIPLAIHPKIQGEDVASVSFVQTGVALKEGYIEYEWKNPGEKAARKKSMYLSYFEPWQWVIATSSYREEFYDLVNLEELRKSILAVRFGETGYPYIIDSKGNIIVHPILEGKNFYNDPDEKRREVTQRICTLKNGKITYFWKNPGETRAREKLVILNYLPEFDWIVASSSYLDEFSLPLYKIKKIFIGLALLCMLLLLAISFLLSAYFTRPIKRLMASFEKGANGDFSVRTSIDSYDEIGKLGYYFNSFMGTFERYAGKLKESEAKYRGIFENSSEGIFQMDEQGNFINMNPSMRSILGYPDSQGGKNDLPVLNAKAHFPVEKWQEFKNELIISKQKVNGFETEFFRNDSSRIWVSMNARLVQSQHGAPPWIEGTVVDISERKKTQAIILQTEKMVSVGGLAAGMAHEINNPLAGMMQNAQVAHNRLTQDLPANIRVAEELGTSVEVIKRYMEQRGILKQLTNINEAGQYAAKIVSNMLSFSRKTGSDFSFHNINELLDKTVELAENDYDLKKKFDFRNIEIVREYQEPFIDVPCDPSKIQQVFFNILKNGAQAMAGQKAIKIGPKSENPIRQSRFTLRISKNESLARIEIEDNGPGMDDTVRKRVFEPFFTTKGVDQGTGLGLSVSYFIVVDDHGGSMTVDSIPEKGTNFIICLPLYKKAQ